MYTSICLCGPHAVIFPSNRGGMCRPSWSVNIKANLGDVQRVTTPPHDKPVPDSRELLGSQFYILI